MSNTLNREDIGELPNPLGLAGLEFIEYSTARPQALGQVLEMVGFSPVARHRSREVTLYRQGPMNVIVNAHDVVLPEGSGAAPAVIAALAFRVRDAGAAYRQALDNGAWAVPVNVEPMELHIPAIHGVGSSRLYFVDRWREFSIYDVDFVPIPSVERHPPSACGLSWFGVVQYIGNDRTEDWTEFYRVLFGFEPVPPETTFGILPKGRVLKSPCGTFYFQLIEPEPGILDVEDDETLSRVAFATPDVVRTVAHMRERGVEFHETERVHTDARGALTKGLLHGLSFELVHAQR